MMYPIFKTIPAILAATSFCGGLPLLRAADVADLMPKPSDFTSMWWAEGFPGVIPEASWLRCIQTGNYAMVLNTAEMKITQLGPVPTGSDYATFGIGETPTWGATAPADLDLNISANGKSYRCTEGGKYSRFKGPRLIESGRFFQRADVTDLVFSAADGEKLNVEARFETAAWPDRLGLILAARPGLPPIMPGEASFGKVGGGFGLDGNNQLEIPDDPALDPERFTLLMWTFVPADYAPSKTHSPWLVCKNLNEETNGNFGITFNGSGVLQARMNIGGGRNGMFVVEAGNGTALKIDAWNYIAMSYDGDTLRLHVNGRDAGEKRIGLKRTPGRSPLVFGRRGDSSGDGYHFRGVVDEIQLYDRALTSHEVTQGFRSPGTLPPGPPAIREWSFNKAGQSSESRSREVWNDTSMEVKLSASNGSSKLQGSWKMPQDEKWAADDWHQASLSFNPTTFEATPSESPIRVVASEIPGGTPRPISYEPALAWHRVNLDGIEPISPLGVTGPSNDAIERVKLVLSNPTDQEQIARLMFEKTASGFRQRIGSAITGISAMLRDSEGNPTGIPVQLSKNWHNDPRAGVYSGQWFHGFSQLRLPPENTTQLELTISYGHWGGVAAASHAQLSLIGWGSNQHWSQSALGAWGESICYEPEQVQAACTITDVRPSMTRAGLNGKMWNWTGNVGGGDFFRFFDPEGKQILHSAVRTTYHRQGPCLTEVTFAGSIGKGLSQSSTVSLARTDDIVRGVYQLRMDVSRAMDFSRFVIFQVGADTYNFTAERKLAIGDDTGLLKEWDAQWGGDIYRTKPLECTGRTPWASLHEAVLSEKETLRAWADRGIVIRSWKAKFGGKDASPWIAEHGLNPGKSTSSTLDILPPPGVTRLEPGDFIEATIEHIVMPMSSADYYGPNKDLQAALERDANTWRMIFREAKENDLQVKVTKGTLKHIHPDIRIAADGDQASFILTRGIGYVPVTFTALSSVRAYTLTVDGKPVDQSIHDNDFWQAEYDPALRTWSRTYNLPVTGSQIHSITFGPK